MAKRKGPLRVKKKRAPGGEKAMATRAVKGRATPERMAQAGGDAYVGADGVQRLCDAPLDSLRARGAITPDQFAAGDRYREDCYKAGTLKSSVVDMEGGGGGVGPKVPGFMATDAAMAASDRVNAANKAVGGGLIDVVQAVTLAYAGEKTGDIASKIFGRAMQQAHAALVEILKRGLNQLAAHYAGMEVDEHGRPMERRSRIRGARDEKPTVREDLYAKTGSEG